MAHSIINAAPQQTDLSARALLFNYSDSVDSGARYVQSFTAIMFELLCENDEPASMDTNDPASKSQRLHACIEAINMQMDKINAATERATSACKTHTG